MNHMAWDDLESMKNIDILPQEDEEFSQYFQNRENFDSVFNEALATLQDLDVPSGYGQTSGPMGLGMSNMNDLDITQKYASNYSQGQSPYRHSKKPSGTAIFGFMDHNRELSFSRNTNNENLHNMKPLTDTVKSISPTQLAKSQRPQPVISNEQLEYNFNQELDECKPIQLIEEDEHEEHVKKEQDIIVTNNNPKSYKFPPDPPQRKSYNSYMGTSLGTIHHPKQGKEYPDDISGLVEEPKEAKGKKYVPIPVQDPGTPYNNTPYSSEKRPKSLFKEHAKRDEFLLDINNVYLPPPSSETASQTLSSSPVHFQMYSSPHHPVIQEVPDLRQSPKVNSSPIGAMNMANSMNLNSSGLNSSGMNMMSSNSLNSLNLAPQSAGPNKFYTPQFFSEDGINEYYSEPIGHFSSSPQGRSTHPKLDELQSSPIRNKDMLQKNEPNDNVADETVTDVNETIVQLTPLKQNPMTPNRNRITLEWSPIISPTGKASQIRKAINELTPRRQIKTTSLLPPGELDRYWEGPDHDKVFTCTYKNCGKKFTRRYNVRSHIQTHLSDRPFTCTYCPKSFVRQHDLNRHVKSHMVQKHVKCKCGKVFTRVEGYKKHLANGACYQIPDSDGGISKPGAHRQAIESMDNVLDGLTSNRLKEELGL